MPRMEDGLSPIAIVVVVVDDDVAGTTYRDKGINKRYVIILMKSYNWPLVKLALNISDLAVLVVVDVVGTN